MIIRNMRIASKEPQGPDVCMKFCPIAYSYFIAESTSDVTFNHITRITENVKIVLASSVNDIISRLWKR